MLPMQGMAIVEGLPIVKFLQILIWLELSKTTWQQSPQGHHQ